MREKINISEALHAKKKTVESEEEENSQEKLKKARKRKEKRATEYMDYDDRERFDIDDEQYDKAYIARDRGEDYEEEAELLEKKYGTSSNSKSTVDKTRTEQSLLR